jgi:hypothetical protein
METAIDVLISFPFIPSSKFIQNYMPHHVIPSFYLVLPNSNKNENTGIVLPSLLTLFCYKLSTEIDWRFSQPRWYLVSLLIAWRPLHYKSKCNKTKTVLNTYRWWLTPDTYALLCYTFSTFQPYQHSLSDAFFFLWLYIPIKTLAPPWNFPFHFSY